MRVFRDGYGVPHLRAATVDELAFLQGRVTAADRGQQIEVERRRSEGLLSELVGPARPGIGGTAGRSMSSWR